MPAVFVKDTSRGFQDVLATLARRRHTAAVILGNGPSLSLLDEDTLRELEGSNYLTIGLNRSIYRFVTDVLIWSDLETLTSILGEESRIGADDPADPMFVVQAVLPVGSAFQAQIERWDHTRSFRAFGRTKLFMFRTVLTAALHLCFLLDIKKILLVGVDLDFRTYFFKTDRYDPNQPYEIRDGASVQSYFRGYSTQRIVKETLESLISREGFEITYVGDSQFLKTVEGLRRVDLQTPNELPGGRG